MSEHVIRHMHEDDLAMILKWRNHSEVRRYMYTQHEITENEHATWFASASRNIHKHLLIFEMDAVPTGSVTLNCQDNNKIADWGFYLAPNAERGSGTALGCAALDYAFDQLGIHKICGQAIDFNERSIRFHQRMGFSIEGTLRDQFFDGQDYHAVLCYGLLRSEWHSNEVKC